MRNRRGLTGLLTLALVAAGAHGALAEPKAAPASKKTSATTPAKTAAKPAAMQVAAKITGDIPLPRKRPAAIAQASAQLNGHMLTAPADAKGLSSFAQAGAAGLRGTLFASRVAFPKMARPTAGPFALASTTTTSAEDIARVKSVLEAARKGKEADADTAARAINDPVARKLAEWILLRSDNTKPSFQRYAAFLNANPSWPHSPLFRRRAENALWNDKLDDNTVRAFFAGSQPTTAKGRFVYARALLAQGDRAGAEALVRQAWRNDEASGDVEARVLEMFPGMLTPADHKWRMHKRFYAGDTEAGLRAAGRLGGNDLLIAKAWAAVVRKAGNAKAALDAVPAAARDDAGYTFARAQWLRVNNKPEEAAALLRTATLDPAQLVDLDQWWNERRVLVRSLLDTNDPKTAYQIARNAATPPKSFFRTDQQFTAGWIALRFLHDPKTAAEHFARIAENTNSPHALGRAGYWQGRAAEALGNKTDAKRFYEAAAQQTATYYGQLARARLGLTDLGLRGAPDISPAEHAALTNLEVVRAVEILYALDEKDLVAPIFAELGESGTDVVGMAALAECAARRGDGRSMLLLGQAAYSRGLPLDYYAFPTIGLPNYTPIGPAVEPAVTYSIARQESHFSQKVVSSAQAMGFMQVTPAAAQDTAKRFKVPYDRDKILKDPIYNMQLGAGELAILLGGYNGNYLLTFAGYNAGRGRVRQWIAAYGDPRDPKVDPVDWAERIPLAETRNYVQRVMENLQVYRARFEGSGKLVIEADLRRGATN